MNHLLVGTCVGLSLTLLSSGCATRAVVWRDVPAGEALLGSPPEEGGRDADEGPQHRARLPSFQMTATPVTVAQFERRADAVRAGDPQARFWRDEETPADWQGRCNLGSSRRDHPVNCVDVRAARAFCRSLGAGADLPTEGEWEHAARAGTTSAFWWGETFDARRVVSSVECGERGCRGGTAPTVTQGPRCNASGLCDLTGQVWEWTQTEYAQAQGDYVLQVDDEVPTRPVHRGGSWQNHLPFLFRSAQRGLNYPKHGLTGVGFRCVRRTTARPVPAESSALPSVGEAPEEG